MWDLMKNAIMTPIKDEIPGMKPRENRVTEKQGYAGSQATGSFPALLRTKFKLIYHLT